jgi:hypothetical protein
MTRRIRWGQAFAASTSLFFATRAFADASARLIYVRGPGAETCPSEAAIRTAVSSRLGYDPFFPMAKDTLVVEATHTASAFAVSLKLVDADNAQRGNRSLTAKGKDCSDILDAMALTISLIIDPDSLERGPRPPPVPEPPPPPTPPPPVVSPPPELPNPVKAVEPAVEPSIHFYAGAALVGAVGIAPAPSGGGRLFAGVQWRALTLDLEARADAPATGNGSGVTGIHVQSWLVGGVLVPCAHLDIFYGCALLSVGSLTASSSGGGIPSSTQSAIWTAVGARAGVEIPMVSALVLRGWVEGVVALSSEQLVVGQTPVYTYPLVSGAVGAGVAWRFF